ncbi:probable 2-carboxy-D-arabinitol-1-phosphatase, partial [Tanacetum coccineum]
MTLGFSGIEEIVTDSDFREIDIYLFQGLLKHEGIAKIDEAFCMWQKDAPNYNIDGHYPVRELWIVLVAAGAVNLFFMTA